MKNGLQDNYSDRNCDRAVFGVTKGINYIEEEEKSLKAQKVMGQQGKKAEEEKQQVSEAEIISTMHRMVHQK